MLQAIEHRNGSKPLHWGKISALANVSVTRMLQHTPSACWMPAWLAALWQAAAGISSLVSPNLCTQLSLATGGA